MVFSSKKPNARSNGRIVEVHTRSNGRFIRIKPVSAERNLNRASQGSNFLGSNFSISDNVRKPIKITSIAPKHFKQSPET